MAAVEVCLVSPATGMDLSRAYMPCRDGELPSTRDLRETLASMWREASRVRMVFDWQRLDFTVSMPDGEFQTGTIDNNGNVVRMVP